MREKIILLVEDNPDDEALALRALKRSETGGKVVVAHDGVEALDYLFATGKHADRDAGLKPGLVLLDLKLPKLDGLEVLRRMRSDERTKLLPVVILSSSREQRDLIESYSLGANSYVRKDVDFVRFSQTIQQLKSYWLSLNEPPPEDA